MFCLKFDCFGIRLHSRILLGWKLEGFNIFKNKFSLAHQMQFGYYANKTCIKCIVDR